MGLGRETKPEIVNHALLKIPPADSTRTPLHERTEAGLGCRSLASRCGKRAACCSVVGPEARPSLGQTSLKPIISVPIIKAATTITPTGYDPYSQAQRSCCRPGHHGLNQTNSEMPKFPNLASPGPASSTCTNVLAGFRV